MDMIRPWSFQIRGLTAPSSFARRLSFSARWSWPPSVASQARSMSFSARRRDFLRSFRELRFAGLSR
jgi:hypothetical protein